MSPYCICSASKITERFVLRPRDQIGTHEAFELAKAWLGGIERGFDFFLSSREDEIRLPADPWSKRIRQSETFAVFKCLVGGQDRAGKS